MPETVNVPLTNIVIPVFNRYDETLETIASVRRNTTRGILTVVNNGSGEPLGKELVRLADEKVIDNLFILDRNYGTSCACNVGWALVQAPFYMKLDNDYKILDPQWLEKIYGMWGKHRHATVIGPVWGWDETLGRVKTPYGVMWTLPISFVGSAFLVSRKVSDALGFFSEDYGLYGEEDADYCLRCHHAGIRKYSFTAEPLMEIISSEEREVAYAMEKKANHARSVGRGVREGILALNFFLYEHKLRDLKVPLKYRVRAVKGRHVEIEGNPEYMPYWEKLMRCLDIYNASGREPSEADVAAMRRILA